MAEPKYDSAYAETLVKWYLRLNGYFIVDNFIVHAGDDPSRISNGIVGNHTEVDVLAIRHQFSKEITGTLRIANDHKLINDGAKIDFVIAETKTGAGKNSRRPNSIWKDDKIESIEYIIRFAGFIEDENTISKIAKELAEKNFYNSETEGDYSIRLIVFSEVDLNSNWKHLVNIKISEIIDFIVDIRGQSWIQESIGVASLHQQWHDLINNIFEIANDNNRGIEQRRRDINALMKEEN